METTAPYQSNQSESLNPLIPLWRDPAVRTSVVIFLLLRIFTSLIAAYVLSVEPAPKPDWLNYDFATGKGNQSGQTYDLAIPSDAPLMSVIAPWHRYDTAWYAKIAIQGYRADNSIVIPPLYPTLMRFLALFVGGNYVLAGIIVSNIACLIAFILLYKLIQFEFQDNDLAARTLLCLAAFPTAYYLLAPYTEPLFLALTLGAFLSALHKRWWWAALFGFLASLTRLQGAVLILPMAWIAYVQYREQGLLQNLTRNLQRIPAVIAAPLGSVSYLLYLSINQLGSLDAAFANEWRLSTTLPWITIGAYLDRVSQHLVHDFESNNAFALILMATLAIIVTFKMRPAYALYVWSTLIIILLRYHDNAGQFESAFRYVLLLFPCFIALGMIVRRWWLWLPYALAGLQWQYHLLNNFLHWRWVA
jgi:hypothetical protein